MIVITLWQYTVVRKSKQILCGGHVIYTERAQSSSEKDAQPVAGGTACREVLKREIEHPSLSSIGLLPATRETESRMQPKLLDRAGVKLIERFWIGTHNWQAKFRLYTGRPGGTANLAHMLEIQTHTRPCVPFLSNTTRSSVWIPSTGKHKPTTPVGVNSLVGVWIASLLIQAFGKRHVTNLYQYPVFLLAETARQVAAESRVDVAFKKIPREVLEKKAVEQGDIKFFELGALSVESKANSRTVSLKLTDLVIPIDDVPEEARKAIKHWSQMIDYWAVDWDFKDDTFHNQWQSYRTRNDPQIELSAKYEYPQPGSYKIVVKVIDILGNDTTKTIAVKVK